MTAPGLSSSTVQGIPPTPVQLGSGLPLRGLCAGTHEWPADSPTPRRWRGNSRGLNVVQIWLRMTKQFPSLGYTATVFFADGRLPVLLLFLLLLASSFSLFSPPPSSSSPPPLSLSPSSPPPPRLLLSPALPQAIPPKTLSVNPPHHIIFSINDLKHWPLTPLPSCYNVRFFFRCHLPGLSGKGPLTVEGLFARSVILSCPWTHSSLITTKITLARDHRRQMHP